MIIAFCGYSRVGKDTAAVFLPNFRRIAFADQLKEDLAGFILTHYGIDVWHMTEEEKKLVRPMLVEHGRIKRAMNPNHWIDLVDTKMHLLQQVGAASDFVITDLRYPNEAKYVLDKGGKVVLLSRPGYEAANEEEARSVMEIESGGLFTRHIVNGGSLDELKKKVEEIA